MLLLLFRRSYCRVPTGTPTKPVATAGRAYGQWYKRNHSFVFRLPQESVRLVLPLQVLVEYMNSNLDLDFVRQSIFLGKIWIMITIIDYYLLARERDRLGMGDFMISDRPFQRQPSVTDFYNPTHPAYLVWGAVTRGRRRYDQDEYRSPDNRYYQPRRENNNSLQDHHWNLCWRRSCSRSRRNSPPLRNQPSPPASPSPISPPPPYTSSVSKRSSPVGQGIPPMVRSKSRDLPSILVSNDAQWKIRFKKVQTCIGGFWWRSAALLWTQLSWPSLLKAVGSVIP